MILEPIKPTILSVRVIPQVAGQLAAELKLKEGQVSIGMITCTSDDALYASLDEGTKMADVEVVYAKSFYAGSAHASGPFSGEIIGIFASHDPDEITSALSATIRYLENKAWFYAADERGKLAFFPHVIPSVGRYLARQAGCPTGTPMAYLIAPPIEAVLGIDAALKAADVKLKVFYPPPSETNFAGGLLVGDLYQCEAAAIAFQETVIDFAKNPKLISPLPSVEKMAESLGKPRGAADSAGARFMTLSGLRLDKKPVGYTHLFDDRSLVPKTHPVIRLRGKFDLLQAYILDAQSAAKGEGLEGIYADLQEILLFVRRLMAAEVAGKPCPELTVAGFSGDELREISHNTLKYLNVGYLMPDASMGLTAVKLNLLRAFTREVELEAAEIFEKEIHIPVETREKMLLGLNRLSSAIYVLTCKVVSRAGQKST